MSAQKNPPAATEGQKTTGASESVSIFPHSDSTAQQLRRRRTAAYRLPPLDTGLRDPLDDAATLHGPGTYGLDGEELRTEANRLALMCGWQLWEVRRRLDVQPRRQHCPCCRHGRKAA
ncbi:hypothetical protein [Streptomyces sp. MUM 178J]|uniref:hypothetical protein n=1 Tax=Streptomyces sp. MUM 178J TaxID=2791991 RepID=UPI001F034D66|nr:hypothetical protein [Streptomyces sp. MUM 178J]WRQ80295.1 hypothetical protein I3F59_013560 [Streptomyces sp. MUM 178J]